MIKNIFCMIILLFALILVACHSDGSDHFFPSINNDDNTEITEPAHSETSESEISDEIAEPAYSKMSESEISDGVTEPAYSVTSEYETSESVTNKDNLSEQESINIEALFEANPIDSYFNKLAEIFVPTSTMDMVQFEAINSSAWEAEMENCYKLLINRTNNEETLELLSNDKLFYVDYIKNHAELDVLFEESNAFSDDGYLIVGSLGRVIRVSSWLEGYRKKTLELFYHLYDIGVTPYFVFSEEKYKEIMRQTFLDSNEELFD